MRPALSTRSGGTHDLPVIFENNYVFQGGTIAIGLYKGAVGKIAANMISGNRPIGIAVNSATALVIDENTITGTKKSGIMATGDSYIMQMEGNNFFSNFGDALTGQVF